MKNMDNVKGHLENHQTYPSTKAGLVATCNNLSDFSEEDKREFEAKLPEGTYNSAKDVMNALNI